MKLTLYTDYSLRVLMYLGLRDAEERVQIDEIAGFYSISKNHLTKVVHHLAKLGYIKTLRGRGGGIMLNYKPEALNIGEVVRSTEDNFHMAECFNAENNQCVLTPVCSLRFVLNDALKAYLEVLDNYTLEDILPNGIPG
ncbi:RrF2 family transcriptional regulator [Salinicoccus halodurans]|uniref:HTH-type transcriptional regulator NsrR n=1 Tax=Salinicoccus halodurans TaxID=407035 RepID=A0A0F7HL70_9STAP|nr:Rrf2 family transcriptional regulator [Salinicoccus halodurans]AKG73619.1 BadM/Rrf2 family transcriptional regulator [Salinicoccus halodurans]SFK53480.1 transcriptional regulator, BadM/Rrf2 family [Salinicoccus halodurans]